MTRPLSASFDPDDRNVVTAPEGQLAHRDLVAHTERFRYELHGPRPGVWSMVGNGISNQNFVEGPEGLVVIDTGESNQEMAAALAEVRTRTDAPVAAVIYTHFHYVGGTEAVLAEIDERGGDRSIPIWGHEGIVGNLQRIGSEVSAAAQRGLVHQMAILMPDDGPDGNVNIGLGREFRRAEHAPFTRGFVAPTHTVVEETEISVGGLRAVITPAPSDADDSVTIWFPELEVAVNNLLWPTLFNVFAIRGEEYRDPRILLTGLDHLAGLGAAHLVGAHGPPISGEGRVANEIEQYRDSIQFLWDQTVRGLNRGLTADELTHFVQLPDAEDRPYTTRQFYGLVEHHVRQIHNGLRGWFDGHEALLFPDAPLDRVHKLIAGFGGPDEVRRQARAALADDDVRWALELATWLVRSELDDRGRIDGGTEDDRAFLATVLRTIAVRTTSSNARNWCVTRAMELDGSLDLARFRIHRFNRNDVLGNPPEVFVHGLRVILDPAAAEGVDDRLRWEFADGTTTGLHVRRSVAVPTDGSGADLAIRLDLATWAEILGTKLRMDEAIDAGTVSIDGDRARIDAVLRCFDHATLAPG